MSLARWEPLTELRRAQHEIDRMLTDWMRPLPGPTWTEEARVPAVDVFERDGNMVMRAEIPGLTKDQIQVTATEDGVRLKGEFSHDEECSDGGYYRHQIRSGSFHRFIQMPTGILPDKVTAVFKDGVLEITAPKAQVEPQEHKIPIEP